jgi:hypothetical protein
MFELTLYEQMGNIGTEIGRILHARKRNDLAAQNNALCRALELFDLTVSDPRRKHQLKEILRARELLLIVFKKNQFTNQSLPKSIDISCSSRLRRV